MAHIDDLKKQRAASVEATQSGPPPRTSNAFFGVGPITNMTADEFERRRWRFEFEHWLEANYRKLNDSGEDIGPITPGEMDRGMHRGYPADKVVLDMMRAIHSYFGFPKKNRMAVGLGGGHTGFSVCVMHLMNANKEQHVFVDSPKPETDAAQGGGFFRQSWATQLLELQHFAEHGSENRIHFSDKEGRIPSADELEAIKVELFIGVGHETTGATTYSEEDIGHLLEWLSRDPENHHAVIDATSMLGAMPWPEAVVDEVMEKCCLFMPLQKAIGGVAGYFLAAFTPEALNLVEANMENCAWAIPRQMKLAVPKDAKQPFSSTKTTELGPFYDAEKDEMLGGIINTFSTLAFAETTFALLKMEENVGGVADMNRRSVANRKLISKWVSEHPLFELGVDSEAHRGAAVTLLKVNDPDIGDNEMHANIITKAKKLLSYDGLEHPNGEHEAGLDVARYINAFPGTPGDFRAWIGGARTEADIRALLENLEYAYHRAKIVVLEEQLAEEGVNFEAEPDSRTKERKDDPEKAYKVLIADAVGLKFNADGEQDISEVKRHIGAEGGFFHEGALEIEEELEPGIHFFYQPDLSTEEDVLPQTNSGQYDAVIAAATALPEAAVFKEGGVRIGAGTGNMQSASWGGGDGKGGEAPLMNTPSFNSRATAQMVMKALLNVLPDLPVEKLHERVVAGEFDTGKHLKDFPTEKLEGKRIAVLGFGNIGREVATLAQAFKMNVVVYSRPRHQDWIESEGFEYADSAKAAASGADVLSPHLGLGRLDENTGKHANEGLVGDEILSALNDGAALINYDRGELVDTAALEKALESGKVRFASIDADIFKDEETGELSGPLKPYLNLEKKFKGRLELLPHAAADTEHISRVEGAKQAVDQIMRTIRFKEVVNIKGDLPEGYTDAGPQTVSGVGTVTPERLVEVTQQEEVVEHFRNMSEELAAFWAAVGSVADAEPRAELLERYGEKLIQASNHYAMLIEEVGLKGPYNT